MRSDDALQSQVVMTERESGVDKRNERRIEQGRTEPNEGGRREGEAKGSNVPHQIAERRRVSLDRDRQTPFNVMRISPERWGDSGQWWRTTRRDEGRRREAGRMEQREREVSTVKSIPTSRGCDVDGLKVWQCCRWMRRARWELNDRMMRRTCSTWAAAVARDMVERGGGREDKRALKRCGCGCSGGRYE